MLETITNQLKPITKDRLTLKEVTELLDTKNFFASSDYHIFKYIKSLPNTLPAQDARVNPNFMVDIHNSTVKDNDIFLFLGDLSESELMDKPEYQNQGIGSVLLKYIIDNKQDKKIMLEVRSKNINAIKLYQKYDFLAFFLLIII